MQIDYKRDLKYSEIKNKFFEKNLDINIKANVLIKEDYDLDIEKLIDRYIKKIEKMIIQNFRIKIQNNFIYKSESSKLLDKENFLKENFVELVLKLREVFKNWYDEILDKKEITIERNIFETGWNYSCELLEIENLGVEVKIKHYGEEYFYEFNEFDLKMEFLKFLVDSLPVIIYIDDFKDKIPREISEKTPEWYNYVNEMLKKHSKENIDIEKNFFELMHAVNVMAEHYDMSVIYSTHPRSAKFIEQRKFKFHKNVRSLKPFGFMDYNNLQQNAFCVVSDSGTIPEEASYFKFPAVSIRTSTERPEGLDKGVFVIGSITAESVLQAVDMAVNMQANGEFGLTVPDYADENVSTKVVKIVQSYVGIINNMIWRK